MFASSHHSKTVSETLISVGITDSEVGSKKKIIYIYSFFSAFDWCYLQSQVAFLNDTYGYSMYHILYSLELSENEWSGDYNYYYFFLQLNIAGSSCDLNSLNLFVGAEAKTETAREEQLQKLRQFDLDWRFGPCTGNFPHCRISGTNKC